MSFMITQLLLIFPCEGEKLQFLSFPLRMKEGPEGLAL